VDSGTDLAEIVAAGNYRAALDAMADRLAHEADDTRWAQHKRECKCICGLGDGRTLVAVLKLLDVVLAKREALPQGREVTPLDRLAAAVDELAPRRDRKAAASGS
jgi:hypothetical protein